MKRQINGLSHWVVDGTITYKGLPGPIISDFWTQGCSSRLYEERTSFHKTEIRLVSNTGTYIDTPFHRWAEGYDLSGILFNHVAGIPGICIHYSIEIGK